MPAGSALGCGRPEVNQRIFKAKTKLHLLCIYSTGPQSRAFLPPTGHLAIPGSICDCHNEERGMLLASSHRGATDAGKHSLRQRTVLLNKQLST